MNDVILNLKTVISNNSTLIVATSGGPDSMCLLYLLLKLKEKNLKVICAHVNHKLRKESDNEALMVQSFCQKNNIIFEYMTIDKYPKGNTENYARNQRYKFFDTLVQKYQANFLLTAHHGDDLIETILMRLIRGSSLKGYAGFKQITAKENYQIYRPLIIKTKDEIKTYADKHNIIYATDKTNTEDIYLRNRIRKYILPYLKKENKNVHLKFLEFSETLSLTEDYLNDEVKKIYPAIYKDYLDLTLFNQEKPILKKKIIYYILKEVYQDKITLITDRHVDLILDTISSEKPNVELNLPLKKIFKKTYDKAFITNILNKQEYNYILKNKVILPNKKIIEIIPEPLDNSNNTLCLNSQDIALPLHVRCKKVGDKILVKGLNGTKKVKDIFIEKKLPTDIRNMQPIVTDNNDQILWLPGLKKSKFDTSKTKNYDIIIRYR